MNVIPYSVKKFPFEYEEFALLLDISISNNESPISNKYVKHFLLQYPSDKLYTNLTFSLYELSLLTNKNILLDFSLINFSDFTDSFYITKIFNNKNYILGIIDSTNDIENELYNTKDIKMIKKVVPENIYTRFNNIFIQFGNLFMQKCNRYINKRGIIINKEKEFQCDAYLDLLEKKLMLFLA